ncbi:TlpA family protein disulfide reductase [Flavobacteriaceae bacterium XHP0103]|uniref:TlpA family protein disulfide reductase n=1 Tax=Marixanthotalea marina TaxID=2844359 RepID=UPI002989E7CB|nr:TlpA disulfide reductase family protein [Marixanthotalea marina]MBU3821823.1 TlpA family protein disulfide reductase [Marixanthotalea marina]
MKLKHILQFAFLFFIYSCQEKNSNAFDVSLNAKNELETIFISEIITNKPIGEIHENKKPKTIQLDKPTVALIHTKNNDKQYLTILAPNKNLHISMSSESGLTTHNISDSLVNYLWKSNAKFIIENASFINKTKNTDSIPVIFEVFRKERANEISKFKDQFSQEVLDILYFQNDARVFAYLFFLGRVNKGLSPSDSYFDFIKQIPEASETLKSLPGIYLYKYEVDYLREHQAIISVSDFLNYIEKKTTNKDLADFLKAYYLKNLIEIPSYWEKHEKLFNTLVLNDVLNSEKSNPYYYLIEQPASAFYSSQNGEPAYLFEAEDAQGNHFSLENLKGKVIFIDTWATWCGPCIAHRPNVLEFAKKYKDNDEVEILLVSVDSSKDSWLSFLEKEDENFGTNLFIENGMRTEYGNRYNIKSIPRYILIGKDGNIINSNINEPSLAVENEIERALAKTNTPL